MNKLNRHSDNYRELMPVSYTHLDVYKRQSVPKMNEILSDYSSYIIGRMGIPYREKGVSIISIVLDAPDNIISSLSGKVGMLPGVSTKTVYSKVFTDTQEEK